MRRLAPIAALTLVVFGCGSMAPPETSRPSGVPMAYFPTGDADRGFQVYERLGCASCHLRRADSAADVTPPPAPVMTLPRPGVPPRTDTELFTAIVDPGHQLAPSFAETLPRPPGSAMPTYRDVLTVQQLLDVIAYIKDTQSPP